MKVIKSVILASVIGVSILAASGTSSAISTIVGIYNTSQDCVTAGHKRYPPDAKGDTFFCEQLSDGRFGLEPLTRP